MAQVKFLKGLQANLPAENTEGQIYFVTDERAIYLDVDADTRIRVGDFIEVENLEALTDTEHLSQTALYYVKDLNALAKYDGTSLKQINPDTGATTVTVSGDGNAVTAASYDAASRTITLTKGATYLDSAGVDSAISTKVGEIGDSATVADYVDSKVSGITGDSAKLTELEEKVNKNTTSIETLNGEAETEGSVKKTVQDAIDALGEKYALASHTHTTDDISDLSEKLATKADAETVTTLSGKVDTIEGVVGATATEGLQKDVADLKASIGGLSGAMHFKGIVTEDPTTMETLDSYAVGDVVVFGEKEYVFVEEAGESEAPSTKKFVELGDTTTLGQQVTQLSSQVSAAEGKVTEVEGKLDGINGTVKEHIESELQAYAKTTDLDSYVQDSELEGYVKTTDLDAYVQDTELADYAKKTDLEWGSF